MAIGYGLSFELFVVSDQRGDDSFFGFGKDRWELGKSNTRIVRHRLEASNRHNCAPTLDSLQLCLHRLFTQCGAPNETTIQNYWFNNCCVNQLEVEGGQTPCM